MLRCSPCAAKMPLESRSLWEGLGARRHWTQIWWYPCVLLLAAGCVCASSTSPLGFINHNLKFDSHRVEAVTVSENRTLARCCLTLRPQRGEFSCSQTWFKDGRPALYLLGCPLLRTLPGTPRACGARLGDSPCALLWHLPAISPTKAGAQSPPLTPHQPCQLPFQAVYKSNLTWGHQKLCRSCPRVWKNPSIPVVTENMGYWEIHCTSPLNRGSTFTGFCSLGFFLEIDSTTKAAD